MKPRSTRQRRLILEELAGRCDHPTAAEIYEAIRMRLPRISLGTVYRNLETLAAGGAVLKLAHCGAPARFDARCEDHYHVRCLACGRVDDVPLAPLPQVEEAIEKTVDYELRGVRLEGVGICPRCQGKRREGGRRPAGAGGERGAGT